MNLPQHADPTKYSQNQVPLCAKSLAAALSVSLDYVYAMRDAGAPFWGRVSTVSAIMEWWRLNPNFRRDSVRKVRSIQGKPVSGTTPRETARNRGITVL